MRAINKLLELATKYRDWHNDLEQDNHPDYDSSGKHYYSIVANLFHVQNGLCAYTEVCLCDPEIVSPEKWEDGQFRKFKFLGQLDHYDPRLKVKNGWLWSNFFMIHSDINMKEKHAYVPIVLKPDNEGFDINVYLNYNLSEHMFYPKPELNDKLQTNLLYDISILGLNHPSIVHQRKMYLTPILKEIQFDYDSLAYKKKTLYQFLTAYEMAVKKLL